MASIAWIEEAFETIDETDLEPLIDRAEAVRIAREGQFWIPDPTRQVYAFVSNLPSLFDWFAANYRSFPWRRTHNPWKIITAEILLQRTHADQVDEVYRAFIDRFPDPEAVYRAERDEIFDVVETLGFGNRKTRTLEALAGAIIDEHDGAIPEDLAALQELPRIGPYTARACLCFAYGKPLALVDSNIATVVEHAFGYLSPRRPHKDRSLYTFLDALVPQHPDIARIFNLALLDLRVGVCGVNRCCIRCPLNDACLYSPLDSGSRNHSISQD